jgi:hypothetical protein
VQPQRWKMLLINNGMQEKIIKIIHYTSKAYFKLSFLTSSVKMLQFLAPGTSNHYDLPNRNHEIKKPQSFIECSLILFNNLKFNAKNHFFFTENIHSSAPCAQGSHTTHPHTPCPSMPLITTILTSVSLPSLL